MKRRKALVGNGVERTNKSSRWNKWGQHRGRAAVFEELESRMLLTGTIALAPTFDYKLYEPHGRPLTSVSVAGLPGLTPAIMKQAYGVNQVTFSGSIVGDGTGQTIAIVDAYDDPNIVQDLHTFDVQFGLPDLQTFVPQPGSNAPSTPFFTKINEQGGTSLPGPDPARGAGWAIETSLDVEWAHAMAPGANIVLVEATSPFTLIGDPTGPTTAVATAANLANATNGVLPNASVVSMSFGETESTADFFTDPVFLPPYAATGTTFVASTGDNGAFGNGGTTKITNYPADSANVVAVGGTTLLTDANGNYISESAWGNGLQSGLGLGGGGGGVSRSHLQPGFQQNTNTGSTVWRTTPDLSLDADPATGAIIVDSWDFPYSSWTVIGGTSLAAPLFAGIMAIVDQGRVVAGQSPLDGPTQTLPAIYSLPSTDFHDITTGNNGIAAGPGYDLATGFGSPIVNNFVQDMVLYGTGTTAPAPVVAPTVGQLTINPSTIVSGTKVTLTASDVTATTGLTVTGVKFYRETNGIAGLQTVSDTLVGSGVLVNGVWTLKISTTGLTAPTNVFYAVATDSAGDTSDATSAELFIAQPNIGSLTITPGTVSAGTPVTLSAGNVTAGSGKIKNVVFYLESNSTAGLQIGSDTLIGTGKQKGNTYTLSASTYNLAAGTYTYYAVATDSAGLTTTSSATLTVQPSPVNNNFANATLISGTSASISAPNTAGINDNATKEAGEPNIGGNLGGKSLWWKWTATSNGTVSLDTLGSDFDTLLGVYAGTAVNKLTAVASNDDASSGVVTSALTFNAVAGKTYYIAVDGYNGISGDIDLNLSFVAGSPLVKTAKKAVVVASAKGRK